MSTLFLAAALALGAGDVELLEFTTTNCPACVKLQPVLERVARAGVPVRNVDAQQRPDLARQFRITQVPTTILVRHGTELDRRVGLLEFEQLAAWVQTHSQPAAQVASGARDRGPPPPTVFGLAAGPTAAFPIGTSPANATPSNAPSAAEAGALAATVRLKVIDEQGSSFGTGTIIDRHGEEALVITCAHIFRESQGKGKMEIDICSAPNQPPVAAQVIDFDLHKDVALVAFRPTVDIKPVPVAGLDYASQKGEAIFSVGCDKGAPPSVIRSQIVRVNKFNGRPNVTVKGQPVDGRSGGGLFLADGRLIGICNAADPTDDEGLYASLPAIHGELDRIGQQRIYQPQEKPAVALVSATQPTLSQPPAAVTASPQPQPDLEILCVVRSKTQPHLPPQVFALDQLPQEVQQRLAAAQTNSGADPLRTAAQPARGAGLIIRAQQ